MSKIDKYLSPASFWTPQYLRHSAWVDHAPFGFWLIDQARPRTLVELGTHGGYSYFAFCQAVKALNLPCQTFAIDTWQGDVHAGFYEEEFFRSVSDYNAANYAGFSRLVRSTFDDALKHFSDGSIDLLHVDGRHFYDDVKHDFESWRPKLSDSAVVLFHDINVRENDFGVFRLWEELRRQHPSFEFLHGHGLGVLAIGPKAPGAIMALIDAGRDGIMASEIRDAYARLGASFKLEVTTAKERRELLEQLTAQNTHIDNSKAEIAALHERLQTEWMRLDCLNAEVLERDQINRQLVHEHNVLTHQRALEAQQALAVKDQVIVAREQAIEGLLNSTSWRVTAPLRRAQVIRRNLTAWIRYDLIGAVRAVYRRLPIPMAVRRAIRTAVFTLGAPLLKNTGSYRAWKAGDQDPVVPAGTSPLADVPREVARPIETDFSAATPFAYGPRLMGTPKLAVIAHAYYEAMIPEFQRYWRNIPFPFDVFVSVGSAAAKATAESYFQGWARGAVTIRVAENRGRDIAPKLITFKDVYSNYEYVLHVHSKASKHADVLATWRGYLLENLLGSPDIVASVFEAFARLPDLGIIASQHFEPSRHWINWGGNFSLADGLARRMGLTTLAADKVLDFPSGSMFWARAAALKPLLDLDLKLEEFDSEKGQIDGTLAHAIERLYYFVAEHAGFTWLKIAHPPLFMNTPCITPIASPEALAGFVADHGVKLTGPNPPLPRKEHPTPIASPSPAFIAKLQARALGSDVAVDPAVKVFVGIVTYNNSPAQLAKVIGSARTSLNRAGIGGPGRIFVIDNGQSTAAMVPAEEGVIRLPSLGNIGFGAGHNALMQRAFADGADLYIAANPDGAFHPDAIAALAQMHAAQDGRALIEALQFPVEHPKLYDPFTMETAWASGACLAIPRDLYAKIGGFDDTFFMYCEDVDLSWRARANGFVVRVCPRALFLHAVTNRPRDERVLGFIMTSCVLLARKWGSDDMAAWASYELKALGKPIPDQAPEKVPAGWRRVADFAHSTSFAATRW